MKLIKYRFTLLSLIILSIVVFIPRNPFILQIPGGDSGVFLYTGWRILQGDILYKNMWDHKPPLIHFINAIGLLFSNNTLWGIWFIQIFFLVIAAVCCFYLLLKYFGYWSALTACIIFILNFSFLINEGNFPQGYVLTLQSISLLLFLNPSQNRITIRNIVLIGVCGACALLLQPNSIGVWIIIFLFLSFQYPNKKKYRSYILGFLIGGFIPLLLTLLYFYFHHVLYDLWNQIIFYNFYYSDVPMIHRFISLYIGLLFFLLSGVTLLVIYGYGSILHRMITKSNKIQAHKILYLFILVGLPIELILSSVSGRYSSNYFIIWLPIFTIISGYSIYQLSQMLFKKIFGIFIFCFIAMNTISIGYISCLQIKRQMKYNAIYHPLINSISTNTTSTDTLLIWGHDVRFLFLTKRKSATKYIYQYPLFTKGYTNNVLILDYYHEIVENQPKYIIEIKQAVFFIEPYSTHTKVWHSIWPTYQTSSLMQQIYKYIDTHYIIKEKNPNWKIYVIKNKSNLLSPKH